jgi:RNA polymerase sigma-70 factor (sigma-E family)
VQAADVAELDRFLAERGGPLLRTAKLLTGSREAGEDLLQAALERLIRRWTRIEGNPEGYLRRTMYNLAADGWRRQNTLLAGQRLLRAAARTAAQGPAGTDLVDIRDALVRLMLQLPARQRTVIVLRYWEGHSEAEVAELLGCSVGNVKSAASRGMARLRELTATADAGLPAQLAKRAQPAGWNFA